MRRPSLELELIFWMVYWFTQKVEETINTESFKSNSFEFEGPKQAFQISGPNFSDGLFI